MDPVEQFLSSFRASRVLETACGDGRFSRRLLEDLAACSSLIGVDPDSREIAEASEDIEDKRIRFELGDARDLRFPAESFDVVAMSNGLHHIPSPERAVAEARRVLEPEGVLIIHEMVNAALSSAQDNGREFHHLKADVDSLLGIPHGRTLAEHDIIALVAGAGFRVERREVYEPELDDDAEAVEARIEFLRGYIQHVCERPEFASIRKRATLLAERIRVRGFAASPQLLLAASKA